MIPRASDRLDGMGPLAPFSPPPSSRGPRPVLPSRADPGGRRPHAGGPGRPPGAPARGLLLGGLPAAPLFLGLPAVQEAVREVDRPAAR
jgi:hypothetical protein